MPLGSKKNYTGYVTRKRINVGSKSEHEAIVLQVGNGHPDMPLRMAGANTFDYNEFILFVGKRISVDGVAGSGILMLVVDDVADITVLGPPGKAARPPQPK